MSDLALATLGLDRFLLDPGSSFPRPKDVVGEPCCDSAPEWDPSPNRGQYTEIEQ
jgi:hypothetical protein